MSLHLTLYVDRDIDNSPIVIRELKKLLPQEQEFTQEKKVYQDFQTELSFQPTLLPVCLLKVKEPSEALSKVLAQALFFEKLETSLYRLKDTLIAQNAVYLEREKIPDHLIIFTIGKCKSCEAAKQVLQQHNISYEEHNPASRLRRQFRPSHAPAFLYENRYLFNQMESFQFTKLKITN